MSILIPSGILPQKADGGVEVPSRASVGVPFTLVPGESVIIAGSGITAKLLNITEDSRCPSDVTCIWAGQVSVLVSLSQNSTSLGNFTLTLGGVGGGNNSSAAAQHSVAGDYVIKLTEVQPYPISTQKIEPSDYVATLVLSRDDDGNSMMARSVLVMALADNNTMQGPTKLISAWSIERENGTAIIVAREGQSFVRAVARFVPFTAQCNHDAMSECIDGQITSVASGSDLGVGAGDFIHIELDQRNNNTATQVFVSFKTPMTDGGSGGNTSAGGPVEYPMQVRKFKEVTKPYVLPPQQDGNSTSTTTTVTLQKGDRDGPLLVQAIYADRIEGLNFPEYPIAMDKGLPITLRVGEKASNGCTVFLTLVAIDTANGTATFLKKVDESRPCPICWYQLALVSG
ncbi:MAG TPA: hypothetical protein VJP79_08755 [Nitrososphaera sp.]|nr:hypothetical protein [Nitrososphaera sp.]